MFSGNMKMINAGLNFLITVPIKKINLYKNQINIAHLKRFAGQRSDSASKFPHLNVSAIFGFFRKHKISFYA